MASGASEKLIANRAVKLGIITDEKLYSITNIKKIFDSYNIKLPLEQIILLKYGDKTARQKYLECILKEVEFPELSEFLDPYSMEISKEWEEILIKTGEKANEKQLDKAKKIKEFLDNKGYNFSVNNILVLLENKKLKNDIKNESIYSLHNLDKRQITLNNFCIRTRKSELLYPKAKISKISGGLITMDDVDNATKDQKELKSNWNIDIPIIHLVINKYKVDPFFLRAVLISQLNIEGRKVESLLGGLSLNKKEFSAKTIPNIKKALKEIENFLKWSFRIEWVNFNEKEEEEILKYLATQFSSKAIGSAEKISKKLSEADFPLSTLKVLFFRENISASKLLESVLVSIYKIEKAEAKKFVKPFADKEKQSLKSTIEIKMPEDLRKSMVSAISIASGPQKKSSAAERLMRRLKEQPAKKEEKKEEIIPEVEEQIEEIEKEEVQEEKEIKEKLITIPINEDFARVREALSEKMVIKEDVISSIFAIKKIDPKKPILDILLERNVLSKENYADLQITLLSEDKVKVPQPSTKLDLTLSNLLIEYHIMSREQVQRVLRNQNILNTLGIRKSINELIIDNKILAPEMVDPLLDQCRKKLKQKQNEPVEIPDLKPEDFSEKEFEVIDMPDKPATNNFTILYIVFFLIIVAMTKFMFFPSETKKRKTARKNTPKVAETKKKENKKKSERRKKFEEKLKKLKEKRENIPEEVNIEKRMKSKGYEKWGNYWVKKKEKEKLVEKYSKTKQKDIEIKIKNVNLKYVSRNNSDGILIQGAFDLPEMEKKKRLYIEIQLRDLKKSSKVYVTRRVILDKVNEFKLIMGPLPKPLMPGLYNIAIILYPNLQNSFIKHFFKLKEIKEWWYKLEVSKDVNYKVFYDNIFKKEKEFIDKTKKLYSKIKELVKNEPEKLKKEWNKWNIQWQKEYKLLTKVLQKEDRFLIPLSDKLKQQKTSVVNNLDSIHSKISDWVAGLSLIPLDTFKENLVFESSIDKLNLILKEKKEELFDKIK